MNAKDIREKNLTELNKQLADLKDELFHLLYNLFINRNS